MVITAQNTELKPGYKQTEVGMIPEDWEVKKLSLITQFANGKAHEQIINDTGDYIVVNSKFISTEGRVIKYSKANLSPLFSGDVAMVMSDIPNGKALAKCFFVRENGKYALNQRICSFRPHNSDSLYLFYKLNRNQYFLNFDSGAGQTNLKKSEVLDCPVAFPPSKTEQTAIASTLSDVDALITSIDRLIAKKRDIKQATMQLLLTGKTRLPGFSGEWKRRKLREIAEIGMGRTPSRRNQNYWGRGYKWLSIGDLKSKYIHETKEEITALAASNMTVIPKGTLVMSFKLTIGKLAFTGCDMYSNEAICSFSKLRADAGYLYYILGETDFSLYGKQAVKGYTLNTDSLNSVEILYPSLPEQRAIATVLSDMDAEIATLEQKRDKTRALKQGMMQELLTGKTRLL